MNTEHFIAKDMSSALRLIKATLGNDAVIHGSRKIDGGIEIEASGGSRQRSTSKQVNNANESNKTNSVDKFNIISADPNPFTSPTTLTPSLTTNIAHRYTQTSNSWQPAHEDKSAALQLATNSALSTMQHEMALLRGLLENGDMAHQYKHNPYQQQPQKKITFMRLQQLGIHANLAQSILDQCHEEKDFNTYWQQACLALAKQIPVNSGDPIEQGGVFAFIGPTGVGKTTTVAKLASRFVMRHGADNIGLITTDCYRVAGREQLGIYGQILNIPVMTVRDEKELDRALEKCKDKKLVLIDTAGISQRDVKLANRLALFKKQKDTVKCYLVLSATSQKTIVEESLVQFGQIRLAGALLTKLDEATELGNIISIFIKMNINIDYLNTGQRVPQDIDIASGHLLVEKILDIEHHRGALLQTANIPMEQTIQQGVVNDC